MTTVREEGGCSARAPRTPNQLVQVASSALCSRLGRALTEMALILRGCVHTILQVEPRPRSMWSSRMNWVTCVVLPQPVSPLITVTRLLLISLTSSWPTQRHNHCCCCKHTAEDFQNSLLLWDELWAKYQQLKKCSAASCNTTKEVKVKSHRSHFFPCVGFIACPTSTLVLNTSDPVWKQRGRTKRKAWNTFLTFLLPAWLL